MDHCAHVIAYYVAAVRTCLETFESLLGIPLVLADQAEDIVLAWMHHRTAA
ncbi:hypothetical protein [Nocardia abscessus]|uniref:hypothetical protein n=1 Tax=Nocardia abscessus TaxID=120957 RepID=UPI002453C392|nr:hypothetical protein [Nocardia abscessus]